MSSSAFRIHTTGIGRTDFFGTAQSTGTLEGTVGGIALVSAAVASQLLKASKVPVTFYGVSGDDAHSSNLRHLLAQSPLDLTCFRQRQGFSPTTGKSTEAKESQESGSGNYSHEPGTVVWDPSVLGESFFQATVNVYAATGMDGAWPLELPDLLAKGHRRGALNVVVLGSDPVEKRIAAGAPLNFKVDGTYSHIDLLLADEQGVCQLAGQPNISESIHSLLQAGLPAVIVAQASGSMEYRSQGGAFGQSNGIVSMHPELLALSENSLHSNGDDKGVLDNFLAGLLTDLMLQILADDFYPKGEIHIERELLEICPLRLRHAIEFGVAAAGLARLRKGGFHLEANRGERLSQVRKYFPDSAPVGRPW